MRHISLFLFSFLFISILSAQTYTVSGKLTDENTGEPLIGATIVCGEKGTVTDFDGNYEIELEQGSRTLNFSYVGYEEIEETYSLKSNLVVNKELSLSMLSEVVVTADIAIERRTPIAFSNIPTLKLQEELASQDIPMILNSTPGTYATQSGGGDGDARITIRGFNQRNVAVMLDGVPVNDMENGWVYWSNWFGLDLVTQTIQVQRGLGASKLSIPSVGGTINILTKGIDAKRGIRFKQEVGNNGFLRSTLGLTSGRMKNGWGVSLAGSYKQGDGWVDGTFTEGYFYYLRVDKQFGNHLFGFQGFGAPQEHGQRPFTSEVAQVNQNLAKDLGVSGGPADSLIHLDRGRRFNEHWGYRDGEVFNNRKNYYHKPQFSLRHTWQANPTLYWSNVAYVSIGNGGGTAPDGITSTFPQDSTGQIDFGKTIEGNQPTVFNPDGKANYYLRSSINNHFWYGLLSTLKKDLTERYTLSGGIDARYYQGDHWREVYDLLGSSYVATEQGSKVVGEIYDYDYTGFVRWLGAFGLLEYSTDRLSVFGNISGAATGYRAEKRIPNIHEIDWENLLTGTVKVGAGYNLDEASNIYINTGYLNKAQRFTNIINTNRFGDSISIYPNFENEKIAALELGYKFGSPKFSANVNAYYTNWINKPLDRLPSVCRDPNADPEDCERISINIPGVDAIHRGVELDFSIKPSDEITLEGLVSIGDWFWNSSSSGLVVLDDGIQHNFEFDATGVHVGDAAQTQLGAMIRYEPIKGAYIRLRGTYFGRNWSDFQPETLKPNTDTARRDSWQMPNYSLFDLGGGYRLKFQGNSLNFRFNILNLFDATYLSDGRNNDGFNQFASTNFDAASASVHYGQGRRWNFSVQAEF